MSVYGDCSFLLLSLNKPHTTPIYREASGEEGSALSPVLPLPALSLFFLVCPDGNLTKWDDRQPNQISNSIFLFLFARVSFGNNILAVKRI